MAHEWPAAAPAPSLLGFIEDRKGRLVPKYPVEYLEPERYSILSSIPAESVTLLLSTDSTNNFLMERARHTSIHRSVCIAEHQTSGRGRRGRSWLSPLGRSLSISLGYEIARSGLRMEGLSLVAGMAVCKLLQRLGGTGCGLKWPNDILVDGKKICGILVEHQHLDGFNKYVVGVGINVGLTREEMGSIAQPVSNTLEVGVITDRTTLAASVTREIFYGLERLETYGFAAFREEFEKLHTLHGQPVRIHRGDGTFEEGVVQGIGGNGALIVAQKDETRSYVSGEISIRKKN